MKRRICLVVLAVALAVGGVTLMTGNVEAQGVPIGGGPCPPGWTCECSSSVVPNVACFTGDGTPGQVVVTVCQKCPPPDCYPDGTCHLRVCRFDVTASCR